MTNLSLHNKTILVTRPGTVGEEFAAQLEKAGAKTIIMPMIEIVNPDSWQQLDAAIEKIDSYQWLFFASANAVSSFCERCRQIQQTQQEYLQQEYLQQKHLQQVYQHVEVTTNKNCTARGNTMDLTETLLGRLPKIAVIGEATALAVRLAGLNTDYCPRAYIAENFIVEFPDYPNLSGQRILWPRTNIGREIIADRLQAAGAIVDQVPAYKTILPENAKDLSVEINKLIQEKQLDVITLASKETAKNLGQIISLNLSEKRWQVSLGVHHGKAQPADVADNITQQIKYFLRDIVIVTIGPQTAAGALHYLGKESLEANPHTNEGMIAILEEYYRCRQR